MLIARSGGRRWQGGEGVRSLRESQSRATGGGETGRKLSGAPGESVGKALPMTVT